MRVTFERGHYIVNLLPFVAVVLPYYEPSVRSDREISEPLKIRAGWLLWNVRIAFSEVAKL